jgi:hypothetical protein
MDKQRSRFVTLFRAVIACAALAMLIGIVITGLNARQEKKYTGNEQHVVSLDIAARYVQNFTSKASVPNIKGGYFGRNIFEQILAQPKCVGIRYYYAKTDSGASTLVLVGVDSTGSDMVQGVLGESIVPCPPWCPNSSPLNK